MRDSTLKPMAGAVLLLLGSSFPASATHAQPLSAEGADSTRVERTVSAFAYVGQYSDTAFLNVFRLKTNFRSSWVGVVGVTRELVEVAPWFGFEMEAQVGQHWGMQAHPEVNALVKSRWGPVPWGGLFSSAPGMGVGLSYALRRPEIEFRPGRPPSRLLIYLLAEIEFDRSETPDWSLFMRVHHRSDGFGAVGEARGSNFVGAGLRHRF